MKKYFLLIICVTVSPFTYGQNSPEYAGLVEKADSLYKIKQYKESGFTYSNAFKTNGWLAPIYDRYNAACSWALAGYSDSAFYNLQRVANKGYYFPDRNIENDTDLIVLHNDNRWQPLVDQLKGLQEKAEGNLNKPLAKELDSMFTEDQKYRQMIGSVESQYGRGSKEMNQLFSKMRLTDSLNLVRVEEILDKYGWLGADVVKDRGNTTLFLVIQHSDLKTQEKYLPMMKEAVKNGKARASELALLVDRVEMGNGRPQIYGSQITMKDGKFAVYQIADEVNVDKRRAEVGLMPLEEYVKNWDIDYKLPTK